MKQHLDIYTGKETTDEEVEIIRQSFTEHFNIDIYKETIRLSDTDLPIVINIALGVVSHAVFALLVLCTRQLFHRLRSNDKRDATVKIEINGKQILIGQQNIHIINFNTKTEDIYDTPEQAYEHLDDESQT